MAIYIYIRAAPLRFHVLVLWYSLCSVCSEWVPFVYARLQSAARVCPSRYVFAPFAARVLRLGPCSFRSVYVFDVLVYWWRVQKCVFAVRVGGVLRVGARCVLPCQKSPRDMCAHGFPGFGASERPKLQIK